MVTTHFTCVLPSKPSPWKIGLILPLGLRYVQIVYLTIIFLEIVLVTDHVENVGNAIIRLFIVNGHHLKQRRIIPLANQFLLQQMFMSVLRATYRGRKSRSFWESVKSLWNLEADRRRHALFWTMVPTCHS